LLLLLLLQAPLALLLLLVQVLKLVLVLVLVQVQASPLANLLVPVLVLLHECPTGPVLEVLGLAIWHERRLVWTFGGVGNHFYYGVEGLQSTEICTRNLTFACVLHQIALFRFWVDVCH
jgi:hypothetical protein